MNNIICVKWGDKYSREYVKKLTRQCEENCSVPFNFYCLTDNPTEDYDVPLPTYWDVHENGKFWAYKKLYMFKEIQLELTGKKFLYLDLDVIIHQDLSYFFELPMDSPWIVHGWWNDIDVCRKNYAKFQSTPINSSIILWNCGQLEPIYNHINKHIETIFFTYPTIDNYINHFWYDFHEEEDSFFNVFPKGDIYSWYKGNIFPNDMVTKQFRYDHKICLFNNNELDNKSEMLNV